MVSVVHLDDLMAAIAFIIEHQQIKGPVNFCAPRPVRNLDFAKALGKILHRPAFMPAPAFMIRLVLGEFGNVLLYSQRAAPDKLKQYGFQFKYPDIESAVVAVVRQP